MVKVAKTISKSVLAQYIANEALDALRSANLDQLLYIKNALVNTSHILSLEDLERIIDTSKIPDTDIRVIKNNLYQKTASRSDLLSAIADKSTLIINHLHLRLNKVEAIAESLSFLFGARCAANAYLSHQGIGGFGIHYDTHDVVIFQLKGSKSWEVYEPTTKSPLFDMAHHELVPPDGKPDKTYDLSSGDILFVPRGYWHRVQPRETNSLHLTFGFAPFCGITFLDFLNKKMNKLPDWRSQLHTSEKDKLLHLISELKSNLNLLGEEFWIDREARLGRKSNVFLDVTFGENTCERLGRLHRSNRISERRVTQNACFIKIGQNELELASGSIEILDYFEQSNSASIDECVVMFEHIAPGSVIRQLLQTLVHTGYLTYEK